MEREIRNNTFNSQEENSNMSQTERDRLESLEAAEMADRGPKTLSPDREMPDTDASAMRAVSNTPGGEDELDDEDEVEDDDLDFDDDEDLDDEDVVADDDDLEVNEDIEEDFTDDDLVLDDEDEEDEDEL